MSPACLLTSAQAANAVNDSIAHGGSTSGAAQLFTVVVVFVFVLVLAYFTTRIVASFEQKQMRSGNIEIVEVRRVTANKYIEIVRIADKYLALAVTRDRISFLTEVSPEELILPEEHGGLGTGTGKLIKAPIKFSDFLNRAKETVSGREARNKDDGD